MSNETGTVVARVVGPGRRASDWPAQPVGRREALALRQASDDRHSQQASPAKLAGTSSASRWYVVHSLPHRELVAVQQLRNQGFQAFLPLGLKARRHARKVETVRAPYFPRYLFVQLDLTRDRWRSVNGTYGVSGLVMREERPEPVPVGVVEGLRALTDATGLLRRDANLRLGGAVRVMAGPFAELVGRLEKLDQAGRVTVLLDLLGGRIPVTMVREGVIPSD